jgi:bacteriocin-type transport-associated protein
MQDVLLRELSNSDIDWMIAAGQRQQVASMHTIIQPATNTKFIYLLIAGSLAIAPASSPSKPSPEEEIVRLTDGEMIGESTLLNVPPLPMAVRAIADSTVLAIAHDKLTDKLQQDVPFAAHFYRAIALLVAERVRKVLQMPGQLKFAEKPPVKEVLMVFGELRDSDIDWFISVGKLRKLEPGEILIAANKPVDGLYIILDGNLSTLIPEGDSNPLALCFNCAYENASTQQEIDTVSRGGICGTISFLDFRLPPTTVRALDETLVLFIPRSQLLIQLQQDLGFAARFYRVIAAQLSDSFQAIVSRVQFNSASDQPLQEMNEAMADSDEMDLASLDQISQGAARFNWMLQQLGVVSD